MVDTITAESLDKLLIPKLNGQIEYNNEVRPFIELSENLVVIPDESTPEHRKIAEYARNPWAAKIVDARVSRLKVAGFRGRSGSDSATWKQWKQWKMVLKEKTIYRESITYGASYVELVKGVGNKTSPVVKSPFLFAAFYSVGAFDDAATRDFPLLAIEKSADGSRYKIWDDKFITVYRRIEGGLLVVEAQWEHGAPVVPIVRYTNDITSDGVSSGDVRPVLDQIRGIMKGCYDMGMINHSNSWNVRYLTGMSSLKTNVPKLPDETPEQHQKRIGAMEEKFARNLAVSDMLIAADKDAKFGVLPATPPGQMVPVLEYYTQTLSGLSSTPAEMLTGKVVGLSAEQAANTNAAFLAIVNEKRDIFGEAHELLITLDAWMTGKPPLDTLALEVVWHEGDGGSLAAQVDALGKSVQMLQIPVEEIWKRYPNVTPEELEDWKKSRAKELNQQKEMAGLIMSGTSTGDPEVDAYDETTEE